MNDVTRQELKEFVGEVLNFAYDITSGARLSFNSGPKPNSLTDLFERGEKLIEQLDKDPTIV